MCDISTQLDIVDALIGWEPELAENTIDRREKNYGSFFKEVDNDGGYQKIDVPMIAYQFLFVFGDNISFDMQFVRDERVIWRAFQPEDLFMIEMTMHQIGRMKKQNGTTFFCITLTMLFIFGDSLVLIASASHPIFSV